MRLIKDMCLILLCAEISGRLTNRAKKQKGSMRLTEDMCL